MKETVLKSWARDLFTFGCILVSLYLNRMYLGGSWVSEFFLWLCFFLCVVPIGIREKCDEVTKGGE